MLNKTIAIYAIIDDLLKAIGHQDDCRRKMSDAEIITTAMVSNSLASITLNLYIPLYNVHQSPQHYVICISKKLHT